MKKRPSNQERYEHDRWEAFLDNIFANSDSIQEVRMSNKDFTALENHLLKWGYDPIFIGITANPPKLLNVPVVVGGKSTTIVFKRES